MGVNQGSYRVFYEWLLHRGLSSGGGVDWRRGGSGGRRGYLADGGVIGGWRGRACVEANNLTRRNFKEKGSETTRNERKIQRFVAFFNFKKFIGVQFHPELSGEKGRLLITHFLKS